MAYISRKRAKLDVPQIFKPSVRRVPTPTQMLEAQESEIYRKIIQFWIKRVSFPHHCG